MDREELDQDPEIDMKEYAQAFNWAYIIAEENPALAQDLQGSLKHDMGDFYSGLKHGFNQFFYEKEHEQVKDRDYEETGEWEKDEEQSRMDELDDLRGDKEDRDIERDI